MRLCVCLYGFLCSLFFELCSENGYAEGQTEPDPGLIELLSVPLETMMG